MRMSTQSHPSTGANRNSSIGANFRMRPVASFQTRDGGNSSGWGREGGGGSGNSPPKQLSKVSPMVAGHAISRPRIQLTRMDVAALSAAREQLGLAGGEEDNSEAGDTVEDTVEVVEEEADEERHEDYEQFEASPHDPGRNRFNLTNIGEESSMLEDSRAEESILEESGVGESQLLEPMEILEEDSQEEIEVVSPEQSFRRQARSSRQSGSGLSRQLLGRTGAIRQSTGQMSRQEIPTAPSPLPQGRLSRPPLRDLSVLSTSPQVDMLKTQRHPAVVLSDLVTMNHPALPPQDSPHSTPMLPNLSPSNK